MTAPDPFAHETRCDLLCFLVIGQLIEQAGNHVWLSPARVSARVRLWLGADHPGVTRADQRTLVRLSIGLASALQSQAVFYDQEMLARLSLEAWRLNFQEPLLAALRAACEDRIERADAAAGATPPAVPAAASNAVRAPSPQAAARIVALSVAAIRKAQGKLNPADLSADSPAWQAVCEDFAHDLQRAPRVIDELSDTHLDEPDDDTSGPKKGKRKTSRGS